jgi:hypothetical protein
MILLLALMLFIQYVHYSNVEESNERQEKLLREIRDSLVVDEHIQTQERSGCTVYFGDVKEEEEIG